MLKSIAYLSTPKHSLTLLELDALFNEVRIRNNKLKIKGVLTKTNNTFFQILEGETEIIDQVYRNIKKDPRHKNIFTILDIPINQLTFDSYSIEQEVLENTNTLYALNEYHNYIQKNAIEHDELFSNIITNLFKE